MAEPTVSDLSEHVDHPALAEDPYYEGITARNSSDKPSEVHGAGNEDLAPLKRYLGSEAHLGPQDEEELRKIMDFAKAEGVSDEPDLAVWLKKLSLKLGTPEMGQSRISQIIGFLDLEHRIEGLAKEQAWYYR